MTTANNTAATANNTAAMDAIMTLVADFGRHLDWAAFADGCDWCCGGGDEWRGELSERRQALGFEQFSDVLRHVLDSLGQYEGMLVEVPDSLWSLDFIAKGGYSLHKPLPELPGWSIAVFDARPYDGYEDENGNWVYTRVAVFRNPAKPEYED